MSSFITASFRKAVIVKYLLASLLVLLVACHTHKHPVKPNKPVNTLIKDKNNNNNANNNNDNNTSGSKFYAKYSKKWDVKLEGTENKKIIESIDSWLGTPYKYGGMSKSGTDCSGFTKSVYKEACNIDLNRSAADQVKDVILIDKDKLHFGDLIFFKISGNKVSHVGIYINDSKFVHASTKNGVTISNLNDAYYKKYFYKGGKINKKT
jgi:cell wall-associated NlpC family hydrolase